MEHLGRNWLISCELTMSCGVCQHLGGGGLTLARYTAAARPGSTRLAVEVAELAS